MPLVSLKTTADLKVDLGGRYITLKGFGLLTQVSENDWADAKKNPAVISMLEQGFIIDKDNTNPENEHADLMSDLSQEQESSIGEDIEHADAKKPKGKK